MDLAEHSEISVLVPHSDASSHHTMVSPPFLRGLAHTYSVRKQITILVTYDTKHGPGAERSLSHCSRVPVSLPVAVNVQDFFRGERLGCPISYQSFTTFSHDSKSLFEIHDISNCAALHPHIVSYVRKC